MSSIFDLKSDSSDSEDDCDYVPPGNVASSDETGEESSDGESEIPVAKKVKLNMKEENKTEMSPVEKKSNDSVWESFLKSVESTPYGKKNQALNSKSNVELNCVKNADKQIPMNDIDKRKPNIAHELIENIKKTDAGDKDVNVTEKNTELFNQNMNKIFSEKIVTAEEVCNPTLEAVTRNKSKTHHQESINVTVHPGRKGIQSIIGTIANKGKKMTVLEKSLQDWNSFKRDEGIEKDLETFNKGRQGFIERQRFLQRSDLRLYETEKSARLSGKRK